MLSQGGLKAPSRFCWCLTTRSPTPPESDATPAVGVEPFGSVRRRVPLLIPLLRRASPIGSLGALAPTGRAVQRCRRIDRPNCARTLDALSSFLVFPVGESWRLLGLGEGGPEPSDPRRCCVQACEIPKGSASRDRAPRGIASERVSVSGSSRGNPRHAYTVPKAPPETNDPRTAGSCFP